MDSTETYVEKEIAQVNVGRPHVVILGAGASLAACPNGDLNGRRLPLMQNLVTTLSLETILSRHSISYANENFEALYSKIHQQNPNHPVLSEIEDSIRTYFAELSLPDSPTIYDHLLLSLRDKDIVATFNWDPFLCQAYARNCRTAKLPRIFFLHGNVAIGYCEEHKQFRGTPGRPCRYCQKPLTSTRLLFPIEKKNYTDDPFIKGEWDAFKFFLEGAFALTIFGYGAPRTDMEAVDLMKIAWQKNRSHELTQTEVIDIRTREDLESCWNAFTFSHHYDIESEFYSSWIAKHPRRSCEAMWNQFMEVMFISDNPLPKEANFQDLRQWLSALQKAEEAQGQETD